MAGLGFDCPTQASYNDRVPHSGTVLIKLPDDLEGYETSKSAVRFAIDKPLPKALVKKLIAVRLKEIRKG